MRILQVTITFILFLSALFFNTIAVNAKALLWIAEEFPQISIKPLNVIPVPLEHSQRTLTSGKKHIIIDVFSPKQIIAKENEKLPTVILALGVRLNKKDKDDFLTAAKHLSKLGFVVAWPRNQQIDRGNSLLEDPETFLTAYSYLSTIPNINNKRISIIGFSTGASIALIAAGKSPMMENLHTFVFFGGYYNILDYLKGISTKTITVDGKQIPWQPVENISREMNEILINENISKTQEIIRTSKIKPDAPKIPKDEAALLKTVDPSQNLTTFKTRIFIIHDKNDRFVPYVESIKLYKALKGRVPESFFITDFFYHVRPKSDAVLKPAEFIRAYKFFYKIITAL